MGGEQVTAKKQAPATPRRMEGPEGHVVFMPHLGDNASLAVLSHREHLASKLLMLSFAEAAKPQMALETSCCEGCTYFSQLPKNRAQCGGGSQPRPCQTSPSCLSHGGREQSTPCLPPLSVKCRKLLSLHGVWGPAPIKTVVKRLGDALPFHVVKGERRSGGKQNPGRLQDCSCQRCLPRHCAMDGWGGS